MRHRLKIVGGFLLATFMMESAWALTFSGVIGMGSSTSKNESQMTEGPFTQAYTLEKLLSSKISLGGEHIRSLAGSLSTSIGYTGMIGRYYFNSAPIPYYKVENLATSDLAYRDYSLYVGSGFGFAQSSGLPDEEGKSTNAAGIYISPRAGVDYQLGRSLGVRAELLMAMTLMGKGNISTVSVGAGIYFIF